MEAPTTRPTAKARTTTWHEIPERQRDNKYITSLTFLHNETCNVYTHLVGALLLPLIATTLMRVLSEPQFLNVLGTDYFMFGIFFWCAECCLIFSATYHLIVALGSTTAALISIPRFRTLRFRKVRVGAYCGVFTLCPEGST
ncbi:hypothetical protein VE03_10278, partial [Pseudogymnoascus sp. 23342-1-I1]